MQKKRFIAIQLALVGLVLSLGLVVACNKAPSDAQLTSDVQNQIQGDSSLASKQQIAVQASNGTVTLNGTVASDAERSLAAIDAAKVSGVKTVVNNLQTAPPTIAETPAPAPAEQTPPPPAPEKKEHHRSKPSAERQHQDEQQAAPQAPVVAENQPPVQEAAPPPPPPPPPVQKVTVPDGTELAVRLVEALDSGRNHAGDVFHGSLSQPIVIDGKVVIPANSDVTGQVTDAKDAGHFSGNSALALKLTSLTVNGKNYQIATEQFQRQGKGRGKNTAEKVGGGAAIGALIGGLIGGGKGAAIGAGVGAGGGTAAQAATHGEQVKLPSESIVNFRLSESLTVTPVSNHKRNMDNSNLSDVDTSSSDNRPTLARHE